uniref:SWIM-type domain-containing protein n=1 Tax=Lactuca sativa TaxID=4236 RepID=A0A9R1V448_LACSA|nr:hypothetical protein LSAT_V11C700373360 [Lactuca sativa]
MSSLSSCSDLHSTINEQSFYDQSSLNMNTDHSNSNNSCSDLHSTINEQSHHNHELVAQDQLHLLRINRTIDFLDESFIHKVGTCNIGASKAYNLVSSMKGGFDSRGGTAVDFKNFHRDLNSKIGVKDSQIVVDILTNIKCTFSNFSFEVQTDFDDHLTVPFWTDNTSKANYKEFGDLLSFDVTYQTNKYSMVFVLFTGVDYHKRCVTFDVDSDDFYRNSLPSHFPNTRYKVVFSIRGESISISCSACFFVQEGVLCRHMFFILNMKEYDEIPSNFILRRWGKDIIDDGLLRKKYLYPHKGSKNECLIQDPYAILRLSINKIANNEDELDKYIKQLQEVDSVIPLCTSSRESLSRSVHIEKIIGAAVPDVINIHNPQGIRNKGWANGKRIKSTRKTAIKTSKKGSRLCSLCH